EDYFRARHVRGAWVEDQLRAAGWQELPRESLAGPAIEYVHPDHVGRIGLLQPYSPTFCEGCHRLRVTATGGLRLCLFGTGSHELRHLLQTDADIGELKRSVVAALFTKAPSHELRFGNCGDIPNLAMTGG